MAAYFLTVKCTIIWSLEYLITLKNLVSYECSGMDFGIRQMSVQTLVPTTYYLCDFISTLNLSVSTPVSYLKCKGLRIVP